MDSGIVVAIIGGGVGIIVAVVSLAPHVGRLRRLERVVDLVEKVEEGEHRDVLVAVRNRLIDAYKPKTPSAWPFGAATTLLYLAALGVVVFTSGAKLDDATRAGFTLLTVILFVAASITGLIAIGFMVGTLAEDIIRMRAKRRARKPDADGAMPPKAEQPESPPGTTSPRRARSVRPRRSAP